MHTHKYFNTKYFNTLLPKYTEPFANPLKMLNMKKIEILYFLLTGKVSFYSAYHQI